MIEKVRCFYSVKLPKSVGQDFNHTYTWSYPDEQTGEIITKKINQVAELQSVDYITPTDILNGAFCPQKEGFYGDVSEVPRDLSGLFAFAQQLNEYINTICANPEEVSSVDKEGEAGPSPQESSTAAGDNKEGE